MEAQNKNKEEIEKISGEIDDLVAKCWYDMERRYDRDFTREELLRRIEHESELQFESLKITELTDIKQATIKTSILWCEDGIEFLEGGVIGNNSNGRLKQLRTHLTWLKEQEKKQLREISEEIDEL